MRAINDAGRTLVKKWEGIMDGDPRTVNLDPYMDPLYIWTIGWGHAIRDLDREYLRGKYREADARALYPCGITMPQAETLLDADLLDAARDVTALVTTEITDDQFAALVSFQMNLGTLRNSTLLQLLNAGEIRSAAEEFSRWVKGRKNGELVTLSGLVSRRAEERALFMRAIL